MSSARSAGSRNSSRGGGPNHGRPLDELIGAGFGVVADSSELATFAEEILGDLATVITVPTGAVPFAVPEGGAAIVRPDRYVVAVAIGAAALAAGSR